MKRLMKTKKSCKFDQENLNKVNLTKLSDVNERTSKWIDVELKK